MSSTICTTVLPALNARCVGLASVFESAPLPREIARFQIKAFALLFSTFEKVLWLDADNFPVSPPEHLFDSHVFKMHGLVTWPDYWWSTVNPKFYTIAAVEQMPPIEARAAAEAGQVLLDKARHSSTLELLTYYNYHGPSHYYQLLSQGAPGEGDKDTFLAAAMALDLPFYQVGQSVATLGYDHVDDPSEHTGVAELQHHPQDDYDKRVRNLTLATPESKPRQMFVHQHWIKADAARMSRQYLTDVRSRMLGPLEKVEALFGFDLEKAMWDEVLVTACDLEHDFEAWRLKSGVCDDSKRVYAALFDGGPWNHPAPPDEPAPAEASLNESIDF